MLLAQLLSACVTEALLEPVQRETSEELGALLMSADGGRLLAITNRYHYALDAPPQLRAAIEFAPQVSLDFGTFVVDSAGHFEGEVRIDVDDISADEAARLAAAGFSITMDDARADIDLQGQRHQPAELPSAAIHPISPPYRIDFVEHAPPAEVALRYAATPLALGVDGVVLLLGMPVMMIVLAHCSQQTCLQIIQ